MFENTKKLLFACLVSKYKLLQQTQLFFKLCLGNVYDIYANSLGYKKG